MRLPHPLAPGDVLSFCMDDAGTAAYVELVVTQVAPGGAVVAGTVTVPDERAGRLFAPNAVRTAGGFDVHSAFQHQPEEPKVEVGVDVDGIEHTIVTESPHGPYRPGTWSLPSASA